MRDLVAALLELQELEIVLQESRILHEAKAPDKLAELKTRIGELRETISPTALKRYDRLRQTGLGVVRENCGVCTSCRLSVPLGDLGRMRRGEMTWCCPNCGRFLLLSGAKRS